MPWSGSGAAIRETPVATGATAWADTVADGDTTISTNDHDFHDQDIANMLDNCVTRDGQNAPTQDLPMGNFKHTGVANATARNQYLAAGQFQDGGVNFAVTTGSSGTYTANLSPVITSYVDGAEYNIRFTTACGANVPTLALNGLAALSIYAPNSQALGIGSIQDLQDTTLRYSAALPGLVMVAPNVPILLESGSAASVGALSITRNLTGFRSFLLKLMPWAYASGANSAVEMTIEVGGVFLGSGYSAQATTGNSGGTYALSWGSVTAGAYFPLSYGTGAGIGYFDIEFIPATPTFNSIRINAYGYSADSSGYVTNITGGNSANGTIQGIQILGSAVTFYKYYYELWGVP